MTVVKRNKKDVWQIQVITGYKYVDNVKKPIKYSEMFYGKKSDARIRETEIKAKIKKGSFISNEKITYNDLIDKWEQEIATPKLEIKTLEEVRDLLLRHLINQDAYNENGNVILCS